MASERKLSVKRLVLFVFLPLVLLIGAAVGVMTSGLLGTPNKDEPPPVPKVDLSKLPGGYVDIPDLIINMRAKDGSPRLLIMQATIHLETQDFRPQVQNDLPKVQSALILFLRKRYARRWRSSPPRRSSLRSWSASRSDACRFAEPAQP